MRKLIAVAACVFPLLALSPPSLARCDCDSSGWVDGCTATVKRIADEVIVTSTSNQCSRVDWYLGDQPQVSVFWGGKESASVASWVTSKTRIQVEDCHVCRDKMANNEAANTPRQIFPENDHGSSDCDAILQKLADLGQGVDVDNVDSRLAGMSALCGSVEACMKRIRECAAQP